MRILFWLFSALAAFGLGTFVSSEAADTIAKLFGQATTVLTSIH